MTTARDPRELLAAIAQRLAPLGDQIVFVGGATTWLFVTDEAAAPARATNDVDVIVRLEHSSDYATTLSAQLRKLGLREDTSEDAPLCRWKAGGIIVDVMPDDAKILGFTNRWYRDAVEHSEVRELEGGVRIRVVRLEYFLATKIEAFLGRGRGDFVSSRDIEDIVAVVDGRVEVVADLRRAAEPVRTYIARWIATWERDAEEVTRAHLRGDFTQDERVAMVRQRMGEIARLAPPRPRQGGGRPGRRPGRR